MPIETTEDYVRVRVMDPGRCQKEHIRTITLDAGRGIKAVICRPQGKDTTTTQAYLFSRKHGWTPEKARAWVNKHRRGKKECCGEEELVATKPKWVHDCIRKNTPKYGKKRAERMCYGAWARQKKDITNTVFRAADGKRYMPLVSSNGYEDREEEYVTTRALKRYVEETWAGDEFKCQPVYFWHDEDYGLDHPIGEIIHAEMVGPFLLEIAKEREDDAYSKAHWDYLEKTDEPQGASIGFRYTIRNFRNREYQAIEKFETSTLPLEYAANIWTFSGVIKMNEDKREEELRKRPGVLDLVKGLRKTLTEAKTKLDEAGIEHKALPPQEGEQSADDANAQPAEEEEAGNGEEEAFANALAEIMAKHFQEVPENFAEIVLASVRELGDAAAPQMVEGGGVPIEEEDEKAKEKWLELSDWLIDTQAEIATAQDELLTAVKALTKQFENAKELPKSLEELASQVEGLATEVETVQKILKSRPRSASREAPVQAGEAPQLSELVSKAILEAEKDRKEKDNNSGGFWG